MHYKYKIRSLFFRKITRTICGICLVLIIYQLLNGPWKIKNSSTYDYKVILTPDAVIPNDNKISISDEIKFGNRSFAENKLWFQEKITHTEDLPLSEYNNQTKRILFWNKDFTNKAL